MMEWLLVFAGGLLGSAHCVGMCGPFALALGNSCRGWKQTLVRQLVFSTGRISTYATIGAFAGYGGQRLAVLLQSVTWVPMLLAVAAGLTLCMQGLKSAGLWRLRRVGPAMPGGCLASTWYGQWLKMPGAGPAFLAGVFTAMLPCGLLYGFVALAASHGNLPQGAAVMALFGLGTVPLLVTVGLGASLISLKLRANLMKVAAWCVIITGVLTILRGIAFLGVFGDASTAACPFCP